MPRKKVATVATLDEKANLDEAIDALARGGLAARDEQIDLEDEKNKSKVIVFQAGMRAPLNVNPGEGLTGAVVRRLDDVCGPGGWDMDITVVGDFYSCRISCRVPDGRGGTTFAFRGSVGGGVEEGDIGTALTNACGLWGIPAHSAQPKVKKSPPPGETRSVATVATPEPQPQPTGGQHGKKPEPVESNEDAIRRWAKKLTACETPDDLNAMLPAIKGETPEEKAVAIWNYTCLTAKSVGWLWDGKIKKFVSQPQSETVRDAQEMDW